MYVVFNIHGEIWSLGGGRNNTLQGEANGPTPFPPWFLPLAEGGMSTWFLPLAEAESPLLNRGAEFPPLFSTLGEGGGRNFRLYFLP